MTDASQCLDLGVIHNECLVFGGPYSNHEATHRLLAEVQSRRIPSARVICTGDVVAYCADPQVTVDLIRDYGIHVVMGNCEESLAADADDCGCGYDEGSSCDLLSVQWYRYARERLSGGAKQWMSSLPRSIAFRMAGRQFQVIHGGAASINRFIFPSTPSATKREELDLSGADAIIAGHSGVPFSEFIDGRLWHNAGVIGMPANDGTPRVWYSVIVPEPRGIRVEHHALSYDHGTAAQSMRDNGLPDEYAGALESGLWPADDVLPVADRKRRGKRLSAETVQWANG